MDEDKDLRAQILVLTERISNLNDQLKRFISHLESEQRVTGEISKRVDQIANELNHLQKQIDEKVRVNKWRIEIIIAIAALGVSIVSSILVLIFK